MQLAYAADSCWRGKLRRRTVRFMSRRPARAPLRPMISFTFDDAPASAATRGADILEAHGLRGSYYVCAALAGLDAATGPMADRASVARLAAAGHEIGCHTYTHLDCGQARDVDAVEDVARNAEALVGWGIPTPATFAYPFGDVAPQTKHALAGRFTLLRALNPGFVMEGSDLNQAPCVAVDGPFGEATALRWVARGAGRRVWLLLCFHDVADDPSPWGCTPRALERIAEQALAAGYEGVTVAEGARRLAV